MEGGDQVDTPGEFKSKDNSSDLVSLAQKLAGLSHEQVFDSVLTGDAETLQLMNQFGGFSEVPFPKPDEIEEFFARIFEAQGKNIFGDRLRLDEIARFCAFGCTALPKGEVLDKKYNALKKKHDAAKQCALTMDSWKQAWGFTLEELEQQLTKKEQEKGVSLTVYIEKMLDLITSIEIEHQEKKDSGVGRKFLFNMNLTLSANDADSPSDTIETDAGARLAAITPRPAEVSRDTVPVASAIAPGAKAAPAPSSSSPSKQPPRPTLPSEETFPAAALPAPIHHEPRDDNAMPDPWDKLATDSRLAAPKPDLLLNNNIFDDHDLSTQLDMLQPLVNQLSAAEDNAAFSDEDDRPFELDEEGAKPFLPSWVTLVQEDEQVRMLANTCTTPIDGNDCNWQNAAEHVRPTRQSVKLSTVLN